MLPGSADTIASVKRLECLPARSPTRLDNLFDNATFDLGVPTGLADPGDFVADFEFANHEICLV
ncbi:hypothetical protein C6P88_16500 [Burkholderia contaminans]|nr:hypothetical protein C6P88_16500 [Burkholderia contaminans]